MGALQDAYAVTQAAQPADKIAAANALKDNWQTTADIGPSLTHLADHPARPETPHLVPPAQVKRRRLGSLGGRQALMHAVAHIEFNAIDLAADMIARFGNDPHLAAHERNHFISDWISVCHDEARHFGLIQNRLQELGIDYGTLPAHNGLWEAAIATKESIAARLAIAPMVLEARGLDVTPAMIEKLTHVGDMDSAAILQIIYDDEIGHVRIGTYWFERIAQALDQTTIDYFQILVKTYFKGTLKRPFNTAARQDAGMPPALYEPLSPPK